MSVHTLSALLLAVVLLSNRKLPDDMILGSSCDLLSTGLCCT